MSDVFAHGQLYVVLSRVRHRQDIRVLSQPQRIVNGVLHVRNMVYPELVDEEPEADTDSPAPSRSASPALPDGPDYPSDFSDEL